MKQNLPLYVCFCLMPKFLDATIRHYHFMLEGLKEVDKVLILFIKINLKMKTLTRLGVLGVATRVTNLKKILQSSKIDPK